MAELIRNERDLDNCVRMFFELQHEIETVDATHKDALYAAEQTIADIKEKIKKEKSVPLAQQKQAAEHIEKYVKKKKLTTTNLPSGKVEVIKSMEMVIKDPDRTVKLLEVNDHKDMIRVKKEPNKKEMRKLSASDLEEVEASLVPKTNVHIKKNS